MFIQIEYGYDGFGRLSSRTDNVNGNVIRYMYAYLTEPTRLTHVYNTSSGIYLTGNFIGKLDFA